MEQEIIEPDPVLRRQFLFIFIAVTIAGGGLIEYLQHTLEEIKALPPDKAIGEMVSLLRLVLVAGAIVICAFSVYLIRFSAKVLRTQQFPPKGTRVIRRTVIRRGQGAVAIAYTLIVLSVSMIVISVAMYIMLPGMLEKAFSIQTIAKSR
ncbi:MAG: hypothetical protein SFH39_08460 [Candidatus Magnetobacterium sp. LHC-1]|uniref:Uncharacterized protein n=1 Tax=Candidatus Magnetobacterium casense TaxID=1455061 RepID=A0ABS6S2M7_9BACT|nr:hypothetical protein [Candidatus Magnetobacterium casensis]MBF0609160.1 hypothetical protein [Nitrospirota bacterium]MBV6343099.1 hypothetical protein [Candidatus Magnetobacterium casensis]